ncbi:GH116 family glycosyl-hydrolase [Arthrobacter sp. MA-N2]|uniref:GH116 family glycosyl-hydrolase n=1 Tax=Arthrobacter sp. MA-N2 TaxID=1101188 RepID=UPI0004BB3916|nr:GH116 family glycosyl-hydrolase [Arthrobacter sp. MA-N2]
MTNTTDWRDLADRVRSYPQTATQAAFPLGGIGTGNVSVGARGELRDWEIFNWPGKGNYMPFTFFAIRTESPDGETHTAVLEAELVGPHAKSHGYFNGELAGLRRFRTSRMWSLYPYVFVELTSPDMPVSVVLEAFTPFVPGDEEASGIPGAVIRYHVTNLTSEDLKVSVVGSLTNALGFQGYDVFGNLKLSGDPKNELRDDNGLVGLYYTSTDDPGSEQYGTLAFATTEHGANYRPEWLKGQWTDNAQDFWDDFRSDGELDFFHSVEAPGSELDNFYDFSYLRLREQIGSIAVPKEVAAGRTESFEFAFTWHVPNRPKGWIEVDADLERHAAGAYPIIRNHYALVYENAWSALKDLIGRLGELDTRSRHFTEAIYRSSLPQAVVEAIAANITVIRSHTCFWLEDGNFYGWEGIRDHVGCGLGNVNHVWNYAQGVAFLFPRLEQTMRRVEFMIETDEAGALPFRSRQTLGEERWRMVPAADGQLGSIVRACREWRLSGDDAFLADVWPGVQRAIEYAKRTWDTDGDLVPDAQQSNTYDIEFYGANGMMGTLMVAALLAGAEMAHGIGDEESAAKYEAEARISSENLDALCWNGSHYVQDLADVDSHRYQFGQGVHSDQLLGQFLAHVTGLGHVLPEDHVRTALQTIVRSNLREEMRQVDTVQRVYALNDEAGLVLCSWPDGGRPRFPFGYSDEIWTGVEYQVAASLVYEGFMDEAEAIVDRVRARQDGFLRNPWSENEAGHHYARSLASYALLTAYSGFNVDLSKRKVSFAPATDGDFTSFWSHGLGWGTYEQHVADNGSLSAVITVIEGELGTDAPVTPAATVHIQQLAAPQQLIQQPS